MTSVSYKLLLFTLIILTSGSRWIYGQDYISFYDPQTNPFNLSIEPEISIHDRGLSFVELEFDIPGAYTNEVIADNDIYQYIHVKGFTKMDKPGSPALPAYNAMIAIPFNAKFRIEILEQESTIHQGYMIHPSLQPARDTYGAPEPEFEKDLSVYNRNEWYPKDIVHIVEVQKLRGVPIATAQFRPVQFNPVTGEIKVYSKIKYRIVFEGSKASFDRVAVENTKHYTNIIKSAVINPMSIPDGDPRGNSEAGEKDYIIITHSEYDDAADSLARWKRQLGYSVEVVSQSSWTAAQVKTEIANRYAAWTPKPDYFVIIGDHTGSYAVPGEIHQDPSYGDDFSTDLYFACMDGGSDFYPDMAHGRISPSTAAEALVIVEKTINYERNPVTDASFYQNGLNCAQYQDDDTNTYADRRFCHTSEDIRDYLQDQQAYTVERIYFTDSPDPTYYNDGYYSPANTQIPAELQSAGFDWNGGSADITSAINAGKFYVFHRDHGYVGGSGWHRPFYTTTSMNSLSNGELLPVIFSINCHTGEFQLSNCFAEKMLRMENKGAVGVVAASYYSYSGYNDGFSIGMINTIWPSPGLTASFGSGPDPHPYGAQLDFVSMGDVVNQGLIRMAATWNNNQYTHELFHWFGDPAMRIWTENPNPNAITASYPTTIPSGGTAMSISSCSEADAIATLCQDGLLLSKETLSGGNGTLLFNPVSGPSPLVLTISKRDCKPLIDNISIESCTLPVSDFSANITQATSATNINFSDLTGCSPISWHWNFPGGYPSYSTDQNPVIRYDYPGTFDVVLTTLNAQGSNTMCKADFITICDTTYSYVMTDNCNAAGSWDMTSGTGNWMNVDPSTPPDDHTGGGNCFITNGNSSYSSNPTTYILTSPSVDLSEITGCELTFWMYLEQEGQDWDGGFIELFDGSNWNGVSDSYLDPHYDGALSASWGNPYGGISAWYADRTVWTLVSVDLSGAGYDNISDFHVRFKFGADNYNQNKTGWAIDDVSIQTSTISETPPNCVWTGLGGDNNWHTTANWSCNSVPTSTTNVFIPQYKPGPYYPETFSITHEEVDNLTIESNAILRVPSGISLTVNGDLTIQE